MAGPGAGDKKVADDDQRPVIRPIISHPISGMEMNMAKGQLRSNKEAKKPKQDKKPAPPAGGFQAPSKTDKTANTKS
jgi:hypothetical protein